MKIVINTLITLLLVIFSSIGIAANNSSSSSSCKNATIVIQNSSKNVLQYNGINCSSSGESNTIKGTLTANKQKTVKLKTGAVLWLCPEGGDCNAIKITKTGTVVCKGSALTTCSFSST